MFIRSYKVLDQFVAVVVEGEEEEEEAVGVLLRPPALNTRPSCVNSLWRVVIAIFKTLVHFLTDNMSSGVFSKTSRNSTQTIKVYIFCEF